MKLALSLAGLVTQVDAFAEYCTYAIDRLKQGPDDFNAIIGSGVNYEDKSFAGRDQLYWLGYNNYGSIRNYEYGLNFQKYAFQRIHEVHSDATMWGNNNPEWHDIMQGGAGTCYIEASMASIAEFPAVVQNVFVTQEKNDEGIYAFRFYIRGKPWIVTVDDYMLFGPNRDDESVREAYFGRIGKNKQYWAMLLEKAWAKVRGNYESANGGFVETGLRSLVGCPVISYSTKDQDADQVFTTIKSANTLNYIMGAGTLGANDQLLNECGIAMGHAYSLIAAFELMNADGVTVDHKLYMMRNPWGMSFYNQTWGSADTTSWTSAYRAQVPHGVNPLISQNDGIYFIDKTDFLRCYDDFQIAHYRDGEGYTDDWFDVENDNGKEHSYEVVVPAKNGDLYFTVESYYYGAVPTTCWGGYYPKLTQTLLKNGVEIDKKEFDLMFHIPMQVLEADYSASDVFTIKAQFNWRASFQTYPAKDYTVKVYSKQNLEVKDSSGKTNMWHMDGQFPSAFTKSHYRTTTTKYTPEFKPRSMQDCWLASNNMQQFANLVIKNPHTLYIWWS